MGCELSEVEAGLVDEGLFCVVRSGGGDGVGVVVEGEGRRKCSVLIF